MAKQVYEIVPSGILGGQFVQNVLHCEVDETTPQNPFIVASQIIEEFNGAGQFVPTWLQMLPEDYKLTSLRVRRITDGGGPTAIATGGALFAQDGDRSGAISSAQVCPLIIWVGIDDPDSTGRTFLPGVSEDDVDEMTLVAGLQTEMLNFVGYWKGGGTLPTSAFPWSGCIYKRATDVGDPIIGGYVSPLIGTQRRRLRPV
jgi:hypothetical protein